MFIVGVGFAAAGAYLVFHALMAQWSLKREAETEFMERVNPARERGLRRTRANEARTAMSHRRAFLVVGIVCLAIGTASMAVGG
jgi:hypothetical protein